MLEIRIVGFIVRILTGMEHTGGEDWYAGIALFLETWTWLPRYVYLGRCIWILKICTLICVYVILQNKENCTDDGKFKYWDRSFIWLKYYAFIVRLLLKDFPLYVINFYYIVLPFLWFILFVFWLCGRGPCASKPKYVNKNNSVFSHTNLFRNLTFIQWKV